MGIISTYNLKQLTKFNGGDRNKHGRRQFSLLSPPLSFTHFPKIEERDTEIKFRKERKLN